MSEITSLIANSSCGAINDMARVQQIIDATGFDVLQHHDSPSGRYGPPVEFKSRRQRGIWHNIGVGAKRIA